MDSWIRFVFLHCALFAGAESLKISAFNVRIFGQTKAGKEDVMNTLAKIILRYDITLIQEIRDIQQTAIYELLDLTNNLTQTTYGLTISERLGRTSSKEQYAFFYRTGKDHVEITSTYQYPDPADVFEREPFAVRVSSPDTAVQDFALVALHAAPDDAVAEVDALRDVHTNVSAHWGLENVVIMGDLNADCSYITNTEKEGLLLRQIPGYTWLIGDDVDTTVGNTDCAYDRIITSGTQITEAVVQDSGKVFRYDTECNLTPEEALDVSDHYPVEFELEPLHKQFRIGSFNVQQLGPTKGSKPDIMSIVAQVIQRYDIILVTEVRDSKEKVIYDLLSLTNTLGPESYDIRLSPRLGRTRMKEQYAFLFRNTSGALTADDVYQYPDEDDVFLREPFSVKFNARNTDVGEFILIGSHVDPKYPIIELEGLHAVHANVTSHWNNDNAMILITTTLSCTFVQSEVDSLSLRAAGYTWLIGDDVETLTIDNGKCGFDRMVLTGTQLAANVLPDTSRVYHYNVHLGVNDTMTQAVSDHFPVETALVLTRN